MQQPPIVDLAIRQLQAYNAADLDAFCACYHPRVRVWAGEELLGEGAEEFRAMYEDKFARGGFGGEVPRRVLRGEVCVEEEHYWSRGPEGTERGALLVRYRLHEGLIGEVRFSFFEDLVEAVHQGLLGEGRARIPGLGRFEAREGDVRFVDEPGEGSQEVAAIRDFLADQDRLLLHGLGTLRRGEGGLGLDLDPVLAERVAAQR